MASKLIEEEVIREISGRRVHVLQKFADFNDKAAEKRRLLVQSGQLQRFLRSAAEFSQTVENLIETAESVTPRHNSEHLARAHKILSRLRGEVDANRGNLTSLERETARLADDGHFATDDVQRKFVEIRTRWEFLLKLLDDKQFCVQNEQLSIDFGRKCDGLLDWIAKIQKAPKNRDDTERQRLFDEIRKFTVVWNEISAAFQQQTGSASREDVESYEKVRGAWSEFQKYVDSLLRELDEHERLQRFVADAEDVKTWMDVKEAEIREKYSKMDVDESMKYRKTIEIEIRSTEQRVHGLREQHNESADEPRLAEHVEDVERRFEAFQKFIEKWRFDLETAASVENLIREAEDIRFWCSEKMEDLKVQTTSESVDLDEISMWIETNNFDFNTWDNVIETFARSAEHILETVDEPRVEEELKSAREAYAVAKETGHKTNEILETRIETINVEKLIFQTHQKAAHLVNVLQKTSDESEGSEDVEKKIRMNDGVAVRCASLVEQIEHIERPEHLEHVKLSPNASEQLAELVEMKAILATSASERKRHLQRRLEVVYFIDTCREARAHTETMLRQLKEGRVKRESVQPVKEQLDALEEQAEKLQLDGEDARRAEEEIRRARDNLEHIEKEHERLGAQSEARKVAERTEKFVERVHTWIEQSKIDEDETDARRVLTTCRHLISASDTYKKAINNRRADLLSGSDVLLTDEPNCLLDGIQHALELFDARVRDKITETETILESQERVAELNSHNDWIKTKIKSLSTEPVWDSLLLAQKMLRRYEKDSEEIEGRRGHINEVLGEKGDDGGAAGAILDEIEHNWSRMKSMFDERGGVLERMIKLFEYDEESTTTSEWLREKMMYADAIEPKEDEAINRFMAKKLEALADDVDNYKPKIVETHALLEDALITPKTKDSVSSQVVKFKSALTRKQGEIESDYTALKRLIEKKLRELRHMLQDADVLREIADMERWIEEEEATLNRQLTGGSDELAARLDDVATNVQRRRANLTDIKCAGIQGGAPPFQTQKIDDAFSALDVFAFELERIRQRAHRAGLLKALTAEVDDVIDAIQTTCERIDAHRPVSISKQRRHSSTSTVGDLPNLDGDLETLRRRVVASLEKAKEVRAANAELAPQVYDLEERLEKEWTEVSRAAEERKKRNERARQLAELDAECLDMEQWIDTFNEEVCVVTGGIHDGLGVQVGLESIDTWREELSHRVDQLGDVKNLLAAVLNTISAQDARNTWLGRCADIESDLVKARKTIDAKQDELGEFSNILGAERDCERLLAWIVAKREVLELEAANNPNAKTVIRKMSEIEKMMMSRAGEIEQLRDFVDGLRGAAVAGAPPRSTFKSNELEEKFDQLDEQWHSLEEELRRKEVDLNESMSQLLLDEQFDKIQQWIEERTEQLDESRREPTDLEKRQRQLDKMRAEIDEFAPFYEDFVRNEQQHYADEESRVTLVREMWSSLLETTTIRQKTLTREIEKRRVFDLLDGIEMWLNDAETEVHQAVNFTSLYASSDAEKASRRLISLQEQAGEKDELLRRVGAEHAAPEHVEKLRRGIGELRALIKTNSEDLEVWKSMQDVVKAIDDEICWFKEISVIVSSTDVGHDTPSLESIRRKHQRLHLETDRRKQKVAKIVDRTTELMSRRSRPALFSKIDEIDEKLAQLTELIENNRQIADIRTHRLEKWHDYFQLIDELREKEHVLEQLQTPKTGAAEAILADVERKREVLETIGEQMDALKSAAEEMSRDEVIRTKAAENAVDKLRAEWKRATEHLEHLSQELRESIEAAKFVWKCDTAAECIRDQEEKIANLVRHPKHTSSFEHAAYHSTCSFVESYTRETVARLLETSRHLRDADEAEKRVGAVVERLNGLKHQLGLLEQKIKADGERKTRVQTIQDEYSRRACELANWLEQAEEDVADVVWFQTKESSAECRRALLDILGELRGARLDGLGELELLEVELAELDEDVNTFTWYSYQTLATRMERLDQTISDRLRIVDGEMARHDENETICEQAAETLRSCRNTLVAVKKELESVHSLTAEEQKLKLSGMIDKLQSCGMIAELERWRSVMGSRYIFDNKHSNGATPHGVLVDTCHCLELMSSMLRSVEQSIAERNASGVSEKQLREFELAFEYFDREKHGWLDYERFELCLKSQGYEFAVATATAETMSILDPTSSRRVLKTDYMRWMVKNETTNILDDHNAIEEALKSLDARKLSDSMSRKEAEFFMRKIAKHTETFTEHIHLEYKDFVDSFY